ncbi:MAG TPA: hypothetical protein VGS96_21405 [Thermoanaerobaculia bacterium]|jgi:hypothetical protein|nr:hypothetical protein [Thermoanaerobaculia bacterium]
MRSTRVLFALLLFGCASQRLPVLPGHYAVQFDPADAGSTVTAISYANSLNEALESSFRSRMEHVDFSSIISAADAYDAVVSVDVFLPRKWSTAAPSRIPGGTSLPPGNPIPMLRYRIELGRTVISSGSVMLDLPQWPPLEGTNVDQVFASAAEQLAMRVVRDLNGLSVPRQNPFTPPVARSR